MKRILLLLIGASFFFSCSQTSKEKEGITFRFNENGQFKIAQFTDLHWDNNESNCLETTEVIKHVLSAEKPDLAILTGDVVTYPSANEGWLAIAKIFEEAEMPWAVIMGNHDDEQGLTNAQLFDIIEGLPYFVGDKGPDMSGSGNYILPVLGSKDDKNAAVLYCMDSHNKPVDIKYGHYDWIHFDQIDWYRNTSAKLTVQNDNSPLPSLAFIHIPLREYDNVVGAETTIGNNREGGVAASDINSGFLASVIEMQDIMGIFAGHDHNNDYIGIEKDIALAYGRVTGLNAYGMLERGSRIIMLYEGQRKFDTWIRTRQGAEFTYYYPSGLSQHDEQTMEYLPAKEVKPKEQGIEYIYYEGGRLKKISDIETNAREIKKGKVENISLVPAMVQDSFALVFKGLINIPETGVYRFYTFSDDGSVLYIDGKMVVDNDGSHSNLRRDGKVALNAGFHDIEVRYIEDYMGEMLKVGWCSRNIPEEELPAKVLYIAE